MRSRERLERVKSLVSELLTAELPSVLLLKSPSAAYWGTWEFRDESLKALPNLNLLVIFQPMTILNDDELKNQFREEIKKEVERLKSDM